MTLSKEDAFEAVFAFGLDVKNAIHTQDVVRALEDNPFPQIQRLADHVLVSHDVDASVQSAKNLIWKEIEG